MQTKITTKDIVSRDSWRVANYEKSLRGYQVRLDILENMFSGLNFKELVNKSEIIIADIGCGPGICGEYFTEQIKKTLKNGTEIKTFFVDISKQMLSRVPNKENYKKIQGDIVNIPLIAGSVDVICIKQVLDYLPKNLQIKALEEVCRVLKKNGQFILSALVAPNREINNLINFLYTEREKIIATKVAVSKFIPDSETLLDLLKEIGFGGEIVYKYDIPLSVIDFKKSFNLTTTQQNKLKTLYEEIILLDKNNFLQGKQIGNDIEFVEQGIILKLKKL